MPDPDLTLNFFKRWDDTVLQQDGTGKPVTRIRFWLGKQGPFDHTFDKPVAAADVDQFIRQTRMDVQQHYRA